MAYKYTHFIPQNTAPVGAKKIGVYNASGKMILDIPLGRLTPTTKQKLYSFGVISDMHLYKTAVGWSPDTKMDAALSYFEEKGCVMCLHCGDITQTGFYNEGNTTDLDPAQFAAFKTVCDDHAISVHGIPGNHESYVVPITSNLTEFNTYTGDSLTYTMEHGDDLFVFVGQSTGTAMMADESLQWLYETLEANRNRRCFVFIHPYIRGDSGDPLAIHKEPISTYWGTKTIALMNLLAHYKNTVLFHGHSHYRFDCQELDKTANYTEKNGFRSVHIPSLGHPRTIVDNAPTYVPEESYAVLVDVYDGCIVTNGVNMINGTIEPIGTFEIDTTLVTVPAGSFTDNTGIMAT